MLLPQKPMSSSFAFPLALATVSGRGKPRPGVLLFSSCCIFFRSCPPHVLLLPSCCPSSGVHWLWLPGFPSLILLSSVVLLMSSFGLSVVLLFTSLSKAAAAHHHNNDSCRLSCLGSMLVQFMFLCLPFFFRESESNNNSLQVN